MGTAISERGTIRVKVQRGLDSIGRGNCRGGLVAATSPARGAPRGSKGGLGWHGEDSGHIGSAKGDSACRRYSGDNRGNRWRAAQ